MDTKWTPGPWVSEPSNPHDGGEFYWLVAKDERGAVYDLGSVNGPQMGEYEANAHLISAAPDLYEALDNLLRVHRGEGGTKYHAGEIAEAALRKARGNSDV